MHFSSATPTGGILARSARRAKTVPATSAAYPPAPQTSTTAPHPHWSQRGDRSRTAREGTQSAEQACPRVPFPRPREGCNATPGQSGQRCFLFKDKQPSLMPAKNHAFFQDIPFPCPCQDSKEKSLLLPCRKRLSIQSEGHCHSVNLTLSMTPASRNQAWNRPVE